MIIRDSIKHPDGVIVEGQIDTSSEFTAFEEYARSFYKNSPDILEGSILYVANEGKFFAKNSSGEWTSGEETGKSNSTNSVSNISSANSSTSDNSLRNNIFSDNKSVLFPDETEVQSDDEILGRSESE